MLHYLLKMTEATLPVAVLFGFFAAFVRVVAGPGRKTALYAAVAAGALSAAVLVALKRTTGFVIREHYNLALLLPMLAAAATLLAMSALLAARAKPAAGLSAAHSRAAYGAGAAALALWVAYYLPYALFFPFEFHVALDSVFTTKYAARAFGWCLGAGLAGLAFLAVRKLTRALSARAILAFFALAVSAMGASQAVAAGQIALARGHIGYASPVRGQLTPVVMRGVQFAEAQGFLFCVIGLGALAALAAWVAARRIPLAAPNPALVRKIRAGIRRHRRWSASAVAVFAVTSFVVTVGAAYEHREVVLAAPTDVTARDGAVRIAVAGINDGKLHSFKFHADDGTPIRFIAIKKNETAFGVGLDACDVCGPSGYYERDGQVVCILCDVVMNKSTIGFPGGCNPVPLAFRLADGDMLIDVADLEAGAWRFKGDHVYQIPSAPVKD